LPEFFKRLKFEEIPKESIPEHKIWTDCIKCIHFPLCNETSLIYDVEQEIFKLRELLKPFLFWSFVVWILIM